MKENNDLLISENELNSNGKVAWPNPIVNRYPASKAEVEKELGKVINTETVLNTIPPSVEAVVLLALGKYSIPAGLALAALKENVRNQRAYLTNLSDGLRKGRYRGIRFVQTFVAGPIYGFYQSGKSYYEGF